MALAHIESMRRFRTIVTVAAIVVGAMCFALVVSTVILAILLLLVLYAAVSAPSHSGSNLTGKYGTLHILS
jgi:hypothetical protein